MKFEKQASLLKKVLELKKEPLSITFTNEPIYTDYNGKISICKALKEAGEGNSFVINLENSACPGGNWHCGLSEVPAGEPKKRLQNFLTRGEKLYHSIVAFERLIKLSSPPPTGLAENIVISPLSDATLRPDIILFLCNAHQACRLISLDTYWDGIQPKIELAGALCHSALSYSVMTGETNLTVGDWTARRHQNYGPDILFVSIPYERLDNLIKAVPLSTAGDADIEIPDDFKQDI